MNKKKAGKTAAVIEIGSNRLKMRIAQLRKGEIVLLDQLEYPLRIGHEVFTTGKISFESLRELSAILRGYSKIMTEYDVTAFIVVATTALREAENRAYVVDQLKIQNDMTVRVLEDDQEKTLLYSETLESLRSMEKPRVKNALVSYIGAGTIGLSVYNGENMIFSQNIPMGALKLHDMLASVEDRTKNFYTVVEEYLNSIIGHVNLPEPEGGLENIVLTGGGVEMIARILQIEPENGRYSITTKQIRELYRQMRVMTPERISERFQLSEDQSEMMYSMLAIYVRLLELVRASNVIAPKVSLWYPLLKHQLIPKSTEEYEEHVRQNAIRCAQEVAKQYRASMEHSQNIRRFACKIFDKMKEFHGLDRRRRLILELAALLHDCGHFVNSKDHLRSTFDLIKNFDIYGMTESEMLIVAYVSRYNEYDIPDYNDFASFQLSEEKRLGVSKLVAIFRVANALDKSQKQKFSDLKVRLDENHLIITVQSDQDANLERWAFEQTAPFFKEVFGITPELVTRSLLLNQITA